MLNNLTGETRKRQTHIDGCLKAIDEKIDGISSSIAKQREDIDGISKDYASLADEVNTTKVTTDCVATSSLSAISKVSANAIEAETVNASSISTDCLVANCKISSLAVGELSADAIKGVSSIDTINASSASIGNGTIDELSSTSVKADSASIGTIEASCINGDITNDKSISTPSLSATSISNETLESKSAAIDELEVKTNAVLNEAHVTNEVAGKSKIGELSTSKVTSSDKVALSKFISIAGLNGTYAISSEDLDIKVSGVDGMYEVTFDNKDPLTLMNISATDCNSSLILELNECEVNKEARYTYSSTTKPLICYEANYDYYRCDKSVHTCNNLWSKHVVFVGRRALDNGVEIAGCLHAECIKLDNPIVDNILVTDSLTSYQNNCLGDAYVFPLEIATGCCSYGKMQIADANPHEIVKTEDGRSYCVDNSTSKTVIDYDKVELYDVVCGEIETGISDLPAASCEVKVSLDKKTGLSIESKSCLDNEHVLAKAADTDSISSYDCACKLADYDGTSWTINNACGLVDHACKDEDGCTIKYEYVHCADSPANGVSIIEGASKEKCLKTDYICKASQTYDITKGLVNNVNETVADQIQTIAVSCDGGGSSSFKIDNRSVIEEAKPDTPLNKVYNVDEDTVYSKSTRLATYKNLDEACCIHNASCSMCIATLADSNQVKGNTSISGDLTINGNIYQCGDSFTTHAEDLDINDATMTVRANAESAMAPGDYAGVVVCKYDGTNDMNVYVDSEGTARLGKSTSLQPFALRDEEANMTDGALVCWNAKDKRIDTACSIDCYTKSLVSCIGKSETGLEYKDVQGCTYNVETTCLKGDGISLCHNNGASSHELTLNDNGLLLDGAPIKTTPDVYDPQNGSSTGLVCVKEDGVAEVGKYLDFHNPGSSADCDGRLMMDGSSLKWNGSSMLRVACICNGFLYLARS